MRVGGLQESSELGDCFFALCGLSLFSDQFVGLCSILSSFLKSLFKLAVCWLAVATAGDYGCVGVWIDESCRSCALRGSEE